MLRGNRCARSIQPLAMATERTASLITIQEEVVELRTDRQPSVGLFSCAQYVFSEWWLQWRFETSWVCGLLKVRYR